jgi:hypothetical protein
LDIVDKTIRSLITPAEAVKRHERRRIMSGISGIANNPPTPVVTAPTKPEATNAPTPAKTEAAPNPPYIVDLTGTALAKSLKLQGHSPEQISVSMGLDIKTIDSYLNVKASEPTLIPAPAQTPTTPADLTPVASDSSATITTPPPIKSPQSTHDLTSTNLPEFATGPSTTSGVPGAPPVPAVLAPPASFMPQSSANPAPSAVKALGI